jgi:hypothetical protein
MSFAKAVQLIKGGSSKWVHDEFANFKKFEWQEGYGAFSVSSSQVARTIAYIERQKSIIENVRSRKRSSSFSISTISNTIGATYFGSVVSD